MKTCPLLIPCVDNVFGFFSYLSLARTISRCGTLDTKIPNNDAKITQKRLKREAENKATERGIRLMIDITSSKEKVLEETSSG